jgi:hypothetical protein
MSTAVVASPCSGYRWSGSRSALSIVVVYCPIEDRLSIVVEEGIRDRLVMDSEMVARKIEVWGIGVKRGVR